jgi:hypothetical protein
VIVFSFSWPQEKVRGRKKRNRMRKECRERINGRREEGRME